MELQRQSEWADEDLVLVSAIQHYSYCPRQCALIHREQIFDENIYTLKGGWAHEIVDQDKVRNSEDVKIVTALPIWSDHLGLVGKCDVVEFHNGIPYPVEYKHGRKKAQIHDELQLCAEAICLEEMFKLEISEGAIYHYSSRRRRVVIFSETLRKQVEEVILRIRELKEYEALPVAVNDERCEHCSLRSSCLPHLTDGKHKITWQMLLDEGEVF